MDEAVGRIITCKYCDVIEYRIYYYLIKRKRRKARMTAFDYVVVSIEGDYANLKRTDAQEDELKLVARALLPEEIAEGTRLHYEYMEYTIVK
jgi:hypothetical protein